MAADRSIGPGVVVQWSTDASTNLTTRLSAVWIDSRLCFASRRCRRHLGRTDVVVSRWCAMLAKVDWNASTLRCSDKKVGSDHGC